MEDEKYIKKELDSIKKKLDSIKKKYSKQYGNIYFQFGILNEIFRFDIYPPLIQDCIDDIVAIREGVEKLLNKQFNLQTSFVENMPLANVIYPVPEQEDFLDQVPSKSTRKVIRKALQGGFTFRPITDGEIEKFWEYWTEVADMKHFFTVSKEQYLELVHYLRTKNTWNLFVSTLDGEIMSWWIYVFDWSVITYLYGFIRRTEKNIGGQHYLTYAMLQRAKRNGYHAVNAMGVAPTGIKNHPLASVGRVKELLWWYKIEHYGNFDLIFNRPLYKLYQRLRR